jgi:hypothetical protein
MLRVFFLSSWVPDGWSANRTVGQPQLRPESRWNDYLTRRKSIRPCVPSHVAYEVGAARQQTVRSPSDNGPTFVRVAPKPRGHGVSASIRWRGARRPHIAACTPEVGHCGTRWHWPGTENREIEDCRMCEARFRLGTCAIAADKKPTLAETLPARRVHRTGKSTNPNPTLHISITHLHIAIPSKRNVN